MRQESGFTLIETIIYIALFTIIIGGGMTATYQIIQSAAAGTNHVVMEEEANFLLRKISWAMVGGRTLSIVGGTSLTITTYDGTSLAFSYDATNHDIKLGTTVLNSGSVKVTALTFTAAGTNGVTTAFTLVTVQNGKPVTEDFSATQYIHQ